MKILELSERWNPFFVKSFEKSFAEKRDRVTLSRNVPEG